MMLRALKRLLTTPSGLQGRWPTSHIAGTMKGPFGGGLKGVALGVIDFQPGFLL